MWSCHTTDHDQFQPSALHIHIVIQDMYVITQDMYVITQDMYVILVCYRLGITPENPAWVGAWWIGFILSGTLALLISVPIFGFPKSLPGELINLVK